MHRIVICSLLALIIGVGGATAQAPKDKPQKKDVPKEKPKEKPKDPAKDKARETPKEAKPASKEVVGMFKSKDTDKKSVTISVDGKERTFRVTSATKIVGPRGGEAELKDERLAPGFKITVTPDDKDPEVAKEIRLPFRNDRDAEAKSKDKSKDKAKDKEND